MHLLIRFAPIALAACGTSGGGDPVAVDPPSTAPIFENSVASNDIDFITRADPTVFETLSFRGQSTQEMPSKLRDGLFLEDTFVFDASFADGKTVPIRVDPAIGDQDAVADLAEVVAIRLGQLPPSMRAGLNHVVVNAGDHPAQEEADGGFFMLYADNIATRLSNDDLSETVFHESAHVSLEPQWIGTTAWSDAVAADAGYITTYAMTDPGEDFAETALFAYTYNTNPERLPREVRTAIETIIPNRTALFETIIDDYSPASQAAPDLGSRRKGRDIGSIPFLRAPD